jgi:hypothetical protein
MSQWRLDFTQEGSTSLTADLEFGAAVALTSGDNLDLTYTGHVTATYSGGRADNWSLSFPGVSPDGAVKVNVVNADSQPLTGTIALGGRVLANLSDGSDGGATLQEKWQGACAP